MQRQTYSYLPSRRASPPIDRYQSLLLGDRGTSVNNLPKVVNWKCKAGSRTRDLQSRKSTRPHICSRHSMRNRVHETVRCPSVCLSVCHILYRRRGVRRVCCCGFRGTAISIDCCMECLQQARPPFDTVGYMFCFCFFISLFFNNSIPVRPTISKSTKRHFSKLSVLVELWL